MNIDRRTIAATLLCIGFYLAYDQYMRAKFPNYGKPKVATSSPSPTPSPETAGTGDVQTPTSASATDKGDQEPEPTELRQLAAGDLAIETDVAKIAMLPDGSGIKSIQLKHYNRDVGSDASPVELLPHPLMIQALPFVPKRPFRSTFSTWREGRTFISEQLVDDWRVLQRLSFPEQGYSGRLEVRFENARADEPRDLTASVMLRQTVPYAKNTSILPGVPNQMPTIAFRFGGEADYEDVESYCQDEPGPMLDVRPTNIDYVAFDSHYFLVGLLPTLGASSLNVFKDSITEESCGIAMVNHAEFGRVGAQGESMIYTVYFGPKDINELMAHNDKLASAIDLGIFEIVAKPLLYALHTFHRFTGNYGIDIIILTILLKILFYPLVKASTVSMHKMKKLNPQMQEIREKFKDDRQRQQQELMKFMAANKINPAKGCLPILPQMPVFFAYFQILRTSIELRHAPFFGWVQDLSAADPYFVIPVLMGISFWVQQKLTPTTGMDKTQEKIMQFMPVMFAGMMLTMPSGLTLYMLVNTLVTIVQQKWLYYKLDKLEQQQA